MHNILYVDLFGDYWRYGIDARIYPVSEHDNSFRLFRVRTGILFSSVFMIALLFSLFWCVRRYSGFLNNSLNRVPFLFLLPLGGHFFLIAASYVSDYGLHKFDIMKWEYVLWGMPFLCVPMIGIIEIEKSGKTRTFVAAAMIIVIVGGFLQSPPLFEKWFR